MSNQTQQMLVELVGGAMYSGTLALALLRFRGLPKIMICGVASQLVSTRNITCNRFVPSREEFE